MQEPEGGRRQKARRASTVWTRISAVPLEGNDEAVHQFAHFLCTHSLLPDEKVAVVSADDQH